MLVGMLRTFLIARGVKTLLSGLVLGFPEHDGFLGVKLDLQRNGG